MQIVTYKRDLLGRFIPSKRKIFKLVAGLVVIGSFYGNYALLKAQYNFRCADGGGYFMQDIECAEIAQAKFDARELDRELRLKEANANYEENSFDTK